MRAAFGGGLVKPASRKEVDGLPSSRSAGWAEDSRCELHFLSTVGGFGLRGRQQSFSHQHEVSVTGDGFEGFVGTFRPHPFFSC